MRMSTITMSDNDAETLEKLVEMKREINERKRRRFLSRIVEKWGGH